MSVSTDLVVEFIEKKTGASVQKVDSVSESKVMPSITVECDVIVNDHNKRWSYTIDTLDFISFLSDKIKSLQE